MSQLVVVKRIKGGIIYKDGYVRLDNVRVSYPHLARPYKGKDDDGNQKKKGSYGIVAMLHNDDHDVLIENLHSIIDKIIKDNEAGKIKADKRFFRDGDEEGSPEYENHWIASAREGRRPSVRTVDGDLLDPDDDEDQIAEMIYGGCYCNVLIRIWYQDGVKVGKGYGKRINAGLVGVQFKRDGDPFGEGRIDDSAAWDSDDDDDDAPPRKKRRVAEDDDDDEPAPRKKRRPVDDDDDEPAPRKKRRPADDDDDDEPPARKKRPADDDDDEPAPRKKRRPADDDDDEL